MTKILDKFVKSVKKLEDYYILKEESTHLTIGTRIQIKKHLEVLNNVFQPYSKNIDVNIYVVFIIPLKNDFPELEEFKKRKIPILILSKKILHGKDEIIPVKEYLDIFLDSKIINVTS